MKLSVVLALTVILGILGNDARAQEQDAPEEAEAVASARPDAQRTPVMVVRESALPVQNQKPAELKSAALKAGKSQPNAQKKDAAKSTQSTATSAPPPPVVMAGQTAETQTVSSTVGTTGNPVYDDLVMKAGARHGVDPNLIFALMRQESGFNPRARSYKGAMGLMQLMPATARRFGVANVYDPAENIEGGVRYLRFLLETFDGDVELALAGYNAGEGAVIRNGYTVPRYRETQNYVKVISARYGRDKHRAGRAQTVASSGPVAPSAMTFSGGGASRLSNNY